MFARTAAFAVAIAVFAASPAAAQEQNNIEELRKMHQEAVNQLKAAQDRKNELAAENEKLTARIAELEKRLAERDVEVAGFAERTWFLRMHYACWNQFIDRYPPLKARWQAFLSTGPLEHPVEPPPFDDHATTG